MSWRSVVFLGGLCSAIAGCQPGKACNDHPECVEGAQCRCDDHGIVLEERDLNGDKIIDAMKYERDDLGRVSVIDSDWGRNGTIERHQEFSYDAQGNRIGNTGWLQQCADTKFHWTCEFEEPCPAPYDKCAKCKKDYAREDSLGQVTPCVGAK